MSSGSPGGAPSLQSGSGTANVGEAASAGAVSFAVNAPTMHEVSVSTRVTPRGVLTGGEYHLQGAALNAAGLTGWVSPSGWSVSSTTNTAAVGITDYQAVTETLSELNTSQDDEWRIDGDVYSTSVQVAAALFDKKIPSPHVFSHGPRSVVFNWDEGDTSLYLTVGKRRVWAAASSRSEIKTRIELTDPSKNMTDVFVEALHQRFMQNPMLTQLPQATAK